MADDQHPFAPLCGMIIDPAETAIFKAEQPIKAYADVPRESGAGKFRYLWECERQILGHDFSEIQTAGTCVSKGIQRAVVGEGCVQIVLRGANEETPKVPASEPIYALGRVEVGQGRLGNGDGLVVSWGIKAVMQWGVIPRGVYSGIDLSKPNDSLAVNWGRPGRGCPDALEPIAREMPVLDTAPVTTIEEVRDAIYNGFYIVGGSDHIPGRGESRDAKGYLRLTGSGGHCTVSHGFNDPEEWIFYNNASWPEVGGPNPDGFPTRGGKLTYSRFEVLLNEGEWYAISRVTGLPSQADELDFVLN